MWCFEWLYLLIVITYSRGVEIMVNSSNVLGELPKFWRSTGFSPSGSSQEEVQKFLLSKEVKINLAIISSLPRSGITRVRIHWLLEMISIDPKTKSYNWSLLDELIDWLFQNNLKLHFELMGTPDKNNVAGKVYSYWKNLTFAIVNRYSKKYGENEIQNWIFETWNEPDLKMYNTINFTLPEYLDYVHGTADGIKEAMLNITFGGPAGLFKNVHHPLCWGILKDCNGHPDRCGFNYLSLHKKGNGTSSEIVKETLQFKMALMEGYRNLSSLPIMNDESDILSGWWKSEEWRGDARYAAALVRTIYLLKPHMKYLNLKYISYDNGFLNIPPEFFNQRTLLTRFYDEMKNVYFIYKPVYMAMGMLALLNEEEISVSLKTTDERFSVLATQARDESSHKVHSLSIVVAYSTDKMDVNDTSTEISIYVNLPQGWEKGHYRIIGISNSLPNPKGVWKLNNKPMFPSKILREAMRRAQGPSVRKFGNFSKTLLKVTTRITLPSVSLLQICSSAVRLPSKVMHLRAINITYNEVLLSWKHQDQTSCIKSYQIQFCSGIMRKGCLKKISTANLILYSFHFAPLSIMEGKLEFVRGYYRVVALDIFNRKGPYSELLHYS